MSRSKAESEAETISANATAVGAGVAVGEGGGVEEGDAFWAFAVDAKHSSSRPKTVDAVRRLSLIVLSAERPE